MDPNGQWKPPEAWPESSPPLPGWRRAEDGSWAPPIPAPESIVDEPGDEIIDLRDISIPVKRPQPEIRRSYQRLPPGTDPRQLAESGEAPEVSFPISNETDEQPVAPLLQFSGVEASLEPVHIERKVRRSALVSVIATALLVVGVSAVVVILLALL